MLQEGAALLRSRDELFGRIAGLVGVDFEEDRRLRTRDDPPVVVLVGGHGMGKTSALGEITRAYGNRVPRVLVDLADERYAASPAGPDVKAADADPANAPLIKILRDLEWDLELRVRRQRLRFPRLSFARLAIATWQPDPELGLDEAKVVLAKASGQFADVRSQAAEAIRQDRQELWTEVFTDIANEIAAKTTPFPANVLLKAAIKILAKKTLTRSESRDALQWHENFEPGEPGNGYEALLRLARYFHWSDEFRKLAEKSLVAAFLADIGAEYHGFSGFSRAGRPIVALDNVHGSEDGIRFLNLVLASRAQNGADPLVIIAAGTESLRTRLDLALAEDGGPRQPPDGWPGRFLSWTDLSMLSYDDTLRMLGTAGPQRTPPGLARLTYRLTSGLPVAVSEISRAVQGKVPASGSGAGLPPFEVTALLGLSATGRNSNPGETVGACILRCLVPDPDLRDSLITFAAAADLEAARVLDTSTSGHEAEHAERFLRENQWPAGPRHFVGDLFLRTLLLDQLGLRVAGKTAEMVHTTLLESYGDAVTEALAARLYHYVALGRVGEAADILTAAFKDREYPADAWLAALRHAACAPCPDHAARPDRRAVALGAVDAGFPDEIHRAVNRLLHAAWYLTDPLIAPDAAVMDELVSDLRFLATNHPTGNPFLSEASRTWPIALRTWRQQTCDQPTSEK